MQILQNYQLAQCQPLLLPYCRPDYAYYYNLANNMSKPDLTLVSSVRHASTIANTLAWLILSCAIVFLAFAAWGTAQYWMFSDIDLTVAQLQWATDTMNGVAIGPEPSRKPLPVFELLVGISALIGWALLRSSSLCGRFLVSLATDHVE